MKIRNKVIVKKCKMFCTTCGTVVGIDPYNPETRMCECVVPNQPKWVKASIVMNVAYEEKTIYEEIRDRVIEEMSVSEHNIRTPIDPSVAREKMLSILDEFRRELDIDNS